MRKTVVFLVLVFLIASCGASAEVSGMTLYSLEQIGITISIPDDYIVITRSTRQEDPALSALDLSLSAVQNSMISNAVYLDAFTTDLNSEIVVGVNDDAMFADFNLLEDEWIYSDILEYLKTQYDKAGLFVEKTSIYQHKQAKFLKVDFTIGVSDSKVFGIQYYSCYKNQAITIKIQTRKQELIPVSEQLISAVVDSAVFGLPDGAKAETLSQDDAVIYVDEESGTRFSVPAGWSKEPFSQQRQFLDVKFVRDNDNAMILYGSVDAYAALSARDKMLIHRAIMGQSFLSASDIADLVGVDKSEVRLVTYGGEQYYEVEMLQSMAALGIDISFSLTTLVRMEKGWMYMFQASIVKDSPFYEEFVGMMNSVVYP